MARSRGVRKISEDVMDLGRSIVITNPETNRAYDVWKPNTLYLKSKCVYHEGNDKFYAAKADVSSAVFNEDNWTEVDLGDPIPIDDFIPPGTLAFDIKGFSTMDREEQEEYASESDFVFDKIAHYAGISNEEGAFKALLPNDTKWSDIPLLSAEAVFDDNTQVQYIIIKSGGENLFRIKFSN